jgi:hypothetical protein
MSKIGNIVEGWKRVGLPTKESEVLYAKRYKHCEPCPSRSDADYLERHPITAKITTYFGSICTECGCPLKAKLRSKNESCPAGKWNAET